MRLTGNVKWFDDTKGFGFIIGDDKNEYFAHYSQIQMEGHKTLEKDEIVDFDTVSTDKGLSASNIVPDAQK